MKRILANVDSAFLEGVQLPQKTKTYTVVSHKQAIEEMRAAIALHGFKITKEEFKSASFGNISTGTFTLNHGDGEMGLMVGFVNSYNKKIAFKYGIGAEVYICSNLCILGADMGFYHHKHNGSVDKDAFIKFEDDTSRIENEFKTIQVVREDMKDVSLSKKQMAELAGRLFIDEKLVNNTQLAIIAGEIDNPSFDYGTKNNTLWDMYNHVTYAGKRFHPGGYLMSHRKVSQFFIDEFNIVV